MVDDTETQSAFHTVYNVPTYASLSYLASRGLFGRLLVRSLLSAPTDGRSGPEPGLTRLMKRKNRGKKTEKTIFVRTLLDKLEANM